MWLLLAAWLALPVSAAEPDPAAPPAVTLALFVETDPAGPLAPLESLLTAELSRQPRLALLERASLDLILAEQKLTLGGLADAKTAVTVGRLAGADRLFFLSAGLQTARLRLVATDSGKVLLEEDATTGEDVFLLVAAIREKLLLALDLKAAIAEQLTVGIAAFFNKSATDRSDELNMELQEALRARLRREPWATVLERQYPTELLEEADLKRLGIAAGPAGELPPADLVVMGVLEDVENRFHGADWEVKLEFSLRLRGRLSTHEFVFRSDALDDAADQLVAAIDAARAEQPAAANPESEKELWRRHATFLMPPFGRNYHFWCDEGRETSDTWEAVRAWENILLLDPADVEARQKLGLCLICLADRQLRSLNDETRARMHDQCMRGAALVEEAFREKPEEDVALDYANVAAWMAYTYSERGREMCTVVLQNPELFPEAMVEHVRRKATWMNLVRDPNDPLFLRLDEAARDPDKDPGRLIRAFYDLSDYYTRSREIIYERASKYLDSEHPLTRFLAERTVAEYFVWPKEDPQALAHFDRAIELFEGMVQRRGELRYPEADLTRIYLSKMQACRKLGREEEAAAAALRGARFFAKYDYVNSDIVDLYLHCVKELTADKDPRTSLELCDAYLRAVAADGRRLSEQGRDLIVLRDTYAALLGGPAVPGFDAMHRVATSSFLRQNYGRRMVAAGGRIWFVTGSGACVYDPAEDRVRGLGIGSLPTCVEAVGDRVFVGCARPGYDPPPGIGLCEFNLQGELVKRYTQATGELPAERVFDLCRGEDQLYMIFWVTNRSLVARLNPRTGEVVLLAPSSREATDATEPVGVQMDRLWWDPLGARLCVNEFMPRSAPDFDTLWTCEQGRWSKTNQSGLRLIASNEDETLRLSVGNAGCVVQFPATGDTVRCEVPLPWSVGEPAWDAQRLWLPTLTGLYEVDRATGRTRLMARDGLEEIYAVLKYDGRLYVATSRGLFWCNVPAAGPADLLDVGGAGDQ